MSDNCYDELSGPQTARILTTSLSEWFGEMRVINYGAILICRKGRARLQVNFNEWDLYEGAVFTLFPNDVVRLSCSTGESAATQEESETKPEGSEARPEGSEAKPEDGPLEVEMLQYSASLLREASLQMEQTVYSSLREDRCRQDIPMITSIVNAMLGLLQLYFGQEECRCLPQLVLLQLKSFFIGFHDYLLRNPQYRPDEIKSRRVRELFNEFMHLLERDFKLSRDVNYYAELMNITPKYLTNIVRKVTGHTPKEVIDQYVILQLKLHLHISTQNIKEIVWEYHFTDVSFFCRYFKKHTGRTPQEYREQ